MRKLSFKLGLVLACCCVGLVVWGVVAFASAPTPEIDNANAKITLNGTIHYVSCLGEDAKNYRTYTGTWNGAEAQNSADATDHSLSGSLTVSGMHWTINTTTRRGVLIANIALKTASGAPIYSGSLLLVTQGLPDSTTPTVYARGGIDAQLQQADEGALPSDDHLIANTEFKLGMDGGFGVFGNLSGNLGGVANYSVVTNVAPTPSDGIC
jgi:hypothetical protein